MSLTSLPLFISALPHPHPSLPTYFFLTIPPYPLFFLPKSPSPSFQCLPLPQFLRPSLAFHLSSFPPLHFNSFPPKTRSSLPVFISSYPPFLSTVPSSPRYFPLSFSSLPSVSLRHSPSFHILPSFPPATPHVLHSSLSSIMLLHLHPFVPSPSPYPLSAPEPDVSFPTYIKKTPPSHISAAVAPPSIYHDLSEFLYIGILTEALPSIPSDLSVCVCLPVCPLLCPFAYKSWHLSVP